MKKTKSGWSSPPKEMGRDEALWYLNVLRMNAGVFQPEIRCALNYAITRIEKARRGNKRVSIKIRIPDGLTEAQVRYEAKKKKFERGLKK